MWNKRIWTTHTYSPLPTTVRYEKIVTTMLYIFRFIRRSPINLLNFDELVLHDVGKIKSKYARREVQSMFHHSVKITVMSVGLSLIKGKSVSNLKFVLSVFR